MASPKLASLSQTLLTLKSNLITTGKQYDQYTSAEHDSALGFRLLASAHLEDYIEQRCIEVARQGIDRAKSYQPTRAGRSLLVWHTVQRTRALPLDQAEQLGHAGLEEAFDYYERRVNTRHGASAFNVLSLVYPLGVKDVDEQLTDKLSELAESRGRAAHLRVNRAKTMVEPVTEWNAVQAVLELLDPLDDELGEVAIT